MIKQNNALAEIQSKYKGCNLLLPSVTAVQINPFYKCCVEEVTADLSQTSGDIFSVGKVKTGEDANGKGVYQEVFALAKPFLCRLAVTAGIQFHPAYTTPTKENDNTYVGKAYGAIRRLDGTYKTHPESKRICLDDEEAKYRLEFMDKSIMGIHDWRAAKAASEMFKGEWREDPEKVNQWGKPEKYYVIADCDRQRYIERSVLVNMTLLRKTASEKAQTGAILRVIRALLGIKGTYTRAELEKPFVVPTVIFAPDYNDPTVRNAMLQQGMQSMGTIFGSAAAAPAMPAAIPSALSGDAFMACADPEPEIGGPAFASGQTDIGGDTAGGQVSNWYPSEPQTPQTAPQQSVQQPVQQEMQPAPAASEPQGYFCSECGVKINDRVYDYSVSKYGKPLCMECQKGAGR
jgi:hypothetical protein